jgi:hypothetical protein
MRDEPPADPPRKSTGVWLLLAVVAILATGAGLLSLAHDRGPPAQYAGLEGTWRDPANPKHAYRPRPDGAVERSWSGLPYGAFGTWERDGQTVVVHTIRNWDFRGTLRDGSIEGQMIETQGGQVLGPSVWKRE